MSVKGVNHIFWNQFGISELQDSWITQNKLFGHLYILLCLFVSVLKQVFCLLQVFSRILHLCFAKKLQKCLVDYDTSPDFISSGGGEDGGIFIFG